MPSVNPMAEVISFGGDASATAGPVGVRGSASAGVNDNHFSAAVVLIGLAVIWMLWASKFRFSMTVG